MARFWPSWVKILKIITKNVAVINPQLGYWRLTNERHFKDEESRREVQKIERIWMDVPSRTRLKKLGWLSGSWTD